MHDPASIESQCGTPSTRVSASSLTSKPTRSASPRSETWIKVPEAVFNEALLRGVVDEVLLPMLVDRFLCQKMAGAKEVDA